MSSDFAFGALCRFGFGSNFPFTQLEIDLFSFDSILCDSKVKRQDSEECSRGCSRVRPQLSQSTQSSDQSSSNIWLKFPLLQATKDETKLNLQIVNLGFVAAVRQAYVISLDARKFKNLMSDLPQHT